MTVVHEPRRVTTTVIIANAELNEKTNKSTYNLIMTLCSSKQLAGILLQV